MAFGLFRKRVGPVIKTEILNLHWDVENPFVYCVRHEDSYPVGNAQQAPPLDQIAGRNLGHDFKERMGFRMYQGKVVPGFPRHPHCGVETITTVRKGCVDHADAFGGEGRYSNGDTHMLTSGKGIQHCEMYPLVNSESENPLDILQIWLNLPSESKEVEPEQRMLWSEDVQTKEENGCFVKVILGEWENLKGMETSEHSWAHNPENKVRIVFFKLDPNAKLNIPSISETANRNIYVLSDSDISVNDVPVEYRSRAKLDSNVDITITSEEGCEILLLEGEPIPGKIVSFGPFFMCSDEEVRRKKAEAINDVWPWPVIDKFNPKGTQRFFKKDGNSEPEFKD